MKFEAGKKAHYESGPNMTPLVDVVMVILIFLMLAGTFGAARHFLPGKAPSGGCVISGPVSVPAPVLEVFVNSPSNDTFRARLGSGESFTDAQSLKAALDARRQAHEASGSSAEKIQVMISPRRSTLYRHVAAAYEAAMEAQWPRIGLRPARE